MKSSADRVGCCPPRGVQNSSYSRKPNSIIVLLFLQNNSKLENKLKHANLGRCIDNASLSGSLGDKGLFRSANILQTADVVLPHAVLTMFLDNKSP